MTTPTEQLARAHRLRELHRPGDPLILVNVWDVAGARVVAAAGAQAVATASYAMSAAAGRPDGEGLDLKENLAIVGRIAEAVDVPVTGDLERGYGRTAEHVAASVLRLVTAGAVGCNLEDSVVPLGEAAPGSGIRPLDQQVERLRAARTAGERAGVPLVINARTDALARGGTLDEVVERGLTYLDAGADCVFVLGVQALPDVARLAEAFDGRLNVLGRPGMPSVAELSAAGVCRISIGSSGIGITHAALSRAAAQLLAGGEYLADQSYVLPG
jgi:2-methylisocitrate lyase-like PEP mutase family enzyme